jgi:integrase
MPNVRRGSIITKSEGTYLIRIFLGRDAEGKRQYVSETVKGTLEDAQRALTSKLYDCDAGRIVVGPRITVSEFLDRWLEAVAGTVEPRTLLFYEDKAKHIRATIGNSLLSTLAPAKVQAAYAMMSRNGLGARSVRHAHAVLRAALRWGMKMRLVGSVATEGVLLPKVQANHDKRTLTPIEAKRVLEVASQQGDSLLALWRVLIECGLRPSEARALRWDDLGELIVDGKTYRTLHIQRAVQVVSQKPRVEEVRATKTDRSRRTIPLTGAALQALEAHRRAQLAVIMAGGAAYNRQNLIFAGRLGEILPSETMLKRWQVLLHKAELPKMRLYDTRHTAATLLLEAGVPMKVVSELLGHSTITLTADTYSHVTATMSIAATAAMDSTLNKVVQA